MDSQTPPNSGQPDPNGMPVDAQETHLPDSSVTTDQTPPSEPTPDVESAPGGPTADVWADPSEPSESTEPDVVKPVESAPAPVESLPPVDEEFPEEPGTKRVSLKCPGPIYRQIEADAQTAGTNPHAFIIDALRSQRQARIVLEEHATLLDRIEAYKQQLLTANQQYIDLQERYTILLNDQPSSPADEISDSDTKSALAIALERIDDHQIVNQGLQSRIISLTEAVDEEAKRADDAISTLFTQRDVNQELTQQLATLKSQPVSTGHMLQERDQAWFKIVADLCQAAAAVDYRPKAAYKRYFTLAQEAYTNQFGV